MRKIQRILITGANGGLGRALLEEVVSKYNSRLICYAHTSTSKGKSSLLKDFPSLRNKIFVADFSSPTKLIQILNKNKEKLQADILINNAAIYNAELFYKYSPEDILKELNVNLTSHMILTNFVLKYMAEKNFGRIINISSGSSIHKGLLPSLPYSLSKNAMNFMSSCLNKEFGKENNIKTLSIIIRFMRTKMLSKFITLYFRINKKNFSTNIPIYSPKIIGKKIIKMIMLDKFPEKAIIKLP